MPLPAIHMVTQLWGRSYVELYADVVIPSLLAPENLPALAGAPPSIYEIHTTEKDRRALERHPSLARLQAALDGWAELRFVAIDGEIDNPYEMMSECHRRAIAAAEQRDAAILFLQPDVVVGPGTLATVRRTLEHGKRLALAPGLRACREDVVPLLPRPDGGGTTATPPTRALVALALHNLHPISEALVWEAGTINGYCSHLYWRVSDRALYARCAHMHPLMVYPEVKGAGFDHTIDWDYFYRACPDKRSWFVAASSDEICLIELSGRAKFAGSLAFVEATPRALARFFAQATDAPHRELMQTPYVFRGGNVAASEWRIIHRRASAIVKEAIRLYKRPPAVMRSGRRWAVWHSSRRWAVWRSSRRWAVWRRFSRLPAIRILDEPLTVLNPIAWWMSDTRDRLFRLKRRHPVSGGLAYWAYLGVYVGARPIYRLIVKLQRRRQRTIPPQWPGDPDMR